MDLRLNETQNMLKKVAADFVKAEAPAHVLTQWYLKRQTAQTELYRKGAGLGWAGMMLPERFGGAGASAMDCAVVFEELGRGPLPGPFFSSGVLGAQLVMEGGSDAQKKTLLPDICSGKDIVVPALTDRGVHFGPEAVQTRLTKSGGNLVLDGSKKFVFDAEAATSFVCAARTDNGDVALVIVDRASPGVFVTPHTGFGISIAEVRFEKAQVPAANALGGAGTGWQTVERALEKTLPILCAYQVGGCQEIFDFTVEYTRTRVVFGQPIGRFQRVQDHVVELSIHLDAARLTTYETLWKLDSGMPARASVHEAKAVASEGYYQACNYAHMVFAGPGTDYQHPLMAHSVLAHTLYQYLGTPLHHKHKMMDALYPRSGAK
ncbi:MAG TPA: acyl-CoA dehydrogenase family protein [Candidatus Acidoferrales bacterium]|nr:acyl-CoA dehydrogenase family protein [Candidatus Acidoferrales bacterium]